MKLENLLIAEIGHLNYQNEAKTEKVFLSSITSKEVVFVLEQDGEVWEDDYNRQHMTVELNTDYSYKAHDILDVIFNLVKMRYCNLQVTNVAVKVKNHSLSVIDYCDRKDEGLDWEHTKH